MTGPWVQCYEAHVPTTLDIPDTPLPDCLRRNARRHPKHTALVFFNARMTFKELNDAVDRFAAGLQKMGVARGDRVALYMPNCPQYVIAYYGVLRAGAVVVPCNPLYVAREIRQQIVDAGATVAVVLSSFYNTLREVRAETPLETVIVANIKEYFPTVLRTAFTLLKEKKEGHYVDLTDEADTISFGDFMQSAPQVAAPVRISLDDTACLLYTGGTTGTPKGAELTHRNLLVNAMQCQVWLNSAPAGEVVLAALPLSHSYGMTTCLNHGIYAASTLILIPNPRDLKFVLSNIQKHKPTLFPGVPTIYVAINNHPDIARYDLRSIRACISGGAGLPKEVQVRFQELTGGNLVEGYGLTEASPVTHANPIVGDCRIGSIGLPWPNTECRLVDIEGGERELSPGEPGELCIRGPQVMKGYWNKPEETAQVLRDGWLFTGDVAVMDDTGHFRIVDRKKDMIITGGENVYSTEVENVLYMHDDILEAAVFGVPDPEWGEAVKACVVLKEGRRASAKEIIAFCKQYIARYKAPKSIDFLSALPRTGSGKIYKKGLRDPYWKE